MPHDLLPGGAEYHVHRGDCVTHMADMPPACVDLVVTSPPFPTLYAYTAEPGDVGNSEDGAECKLHLGYFYRQLCRVLRPGRVAIVHVMQVPRLKRSGGQGLSDFRGLNVRVAERAGLVFCYDWHIRKNPQALRDGSRVLTPRGWVPIESLVIGSRVIGSGGTPVNVTGVHPQGVRPVYRLKTSDGGSVDCDGRHLWTVRTTAGVSRDGPLVTHTTEELMRRGLFMASGEPRFFLPIMDGPARLDGHELPLHPYLIGAMLGDGMLTTRSSVGICTQRGIAERLPLPAGHSLRQLSGSEKGGDVASWHVLGDGRQNVVLDRLRDLGLHGCRAWEKFIPEQYLAADEASRRELLAGLIDTDGGNKRKGGIKYHTTSPRLAEGFRALVESLGGLCTLIRRTGGAYSHKGEARTGRDIYELTPRLRDGLCPFRYGPKAAAWRPAAKRMRRAVVSIEPAGEAPCTCITVDAADGLFVTENCIVTHNSQAVRTHSHELQFAGLERDRARSRGALGDYCLKFVAPGENAVPVDSRGPGEVSRDDWIAYAEGSWGADAVPETDTLNVSRAKGEGDTKHVCPLQLAVYQRFARLYTNPGEVLFDPFAGVGSGGFAALGGESPKTKRCVENPRRFYGCELKPEYHAAALANCARAVAQREARKKDLFSSLPREKGGAA